MISRISVGTWVALEEEEVEEEDEAQMDGVVELGEGEEEEEEEAPTSLPLLFISLLSVLSLGFTRESVVVIFIFVVSLGFH